MFFDIKEITTNSIVFVLFLYTNVCIFMWACINLPTYGNKYLLFKGILTVEFLE